jgi:ribosome-binding factor A
LAAERRLRAERAYAEAFAEALRSLKTPLPALCSVVRVDMSADLRVARVHLSIYGERLERQATGRAVTRARAFLQGEVGRRLGLRFTPHLEIVPDRSISEVVRLGALMPADAPRGGEGDDVHRDDGSGAGRGPSRP